MQLFFWDFSDHQFCLIRDLTHADKKYLQTIQSQSDQNKNWFVFWAIHHLLQYNYNCIFFPLQHPSADGKITSNLYARILTVHTNLWGFFLHHVSIQIHFTKHVVCQSATDLMIYCYIHMLCPYFKLMTIPNN